MTIGMAWGYVPPEKREFPIDESVRPCDDFYAYACNKVRASFELPADRSHYAFSFNDAAERILEAKKSYLSGLSSSRPLSPRETQISRFYSACMNEPEAMNEERRIVQATRQRVEAIETRDDLLVLFSKNLGTSDYSPVDFGTIANQDNPEQKDLYLATSVMTLEVRTEYENEEFLKDFRNLLTQFFKSIGTDNPERRALRIVHLEKSLAKTYPLPDEIRETVNSRTQISKNSLIEKFKNLRLAQFLSRIPESTLIRDLMPEHFGALDHALASENLETLKDLYLYRKLGSLLDSAYPEFILWSVPFNRKYLGGSKARPPRQERCTRLTTKTLAHEIDAELMPVLFPSFPAEKIIALAEKVRSAIITGIDKNTWLSPGSKGGAIKKMGVALLQLAAPKTEMEWDFKPVVDFSAKGMISNLDLLKTALSEKEIRELALPRDRTQWITNPILVNAFYMPPDNRFVLPVGILQAPFFSPDAPEHVNLGGIGAIIGHELGHAVDNMGSRYDERGRLNQWMTDIDLKKYLDLSSRLIAQFDAIGHNGKLTLGENGGDLVGLTFAFQAAFPENEGSLDHKKEFFLQYARNYCGVARPEFEEYLLKNDAHALDRARVNEQVKHQDGFHEAYQCMSGDKLFLALPDRVRIW